MIYLGSDGKKHRSKHSLHVMKLRGNPKLYLMLLVPFTKEGETHGWFHVPEEYGGKLAMTGPSTREMINVHYSRQPDEFKRLAGIAVEYIDNLGTPIENDESIF